MAPLGPAERVLVSQQFLNSPHGQIKCTSCHGGDPNTSLSKEAKAEAHSAQKNFVAYPSEQADTYCGSCHSDKTSKFANALHYTQEGYYQRFMIRAGGQDLRNDPKMAAGFNKDCAKCHASCGQCHVIRPVSVNGGLEKAHVFYETPSMVNNCTACHGSRVGEEYRGLHAGEEGWPEGIKADVHYNKGYQCTFCHKGSEMHGDGTEYTYRYVDNPNFVPQCVDCHQDVLDANTDNQYHKTHVQGSKKLECQICHSQTYKSCNSCHVRKGITGHSYPTFKIGKNYMKSDMRNYDLILVRHIPIAPDTYDNWGGSISLTTFDAAPTWKYATPHNIQRWTTQTDTTGTSWCGESCHNNFDKYLLTPADVDSNYLDAELKANAPVFVK